MSALLSYRSYIYIWLSMHVFTLVYSHSTTSHSLTFVDPVTATIDGIFFVWRICYQCSNQYTACIVVLELLQNQVETNERLQRALTYLNKFMLEEGGTSQGRKWHSI